MVSQKSGVSSPAAVVRSWSRARLSAALWSKRAEDSDDGGSVSATARMICSAAARRVAAFVFGGVLEWGGAGRDGVGRGGTGLHGDEWGRDEHGAGDSSGDGEAESESEQRGRDHREDSGRDESADEEEQRRGDS